MVKRIVGYLLRIVALIGGFYLMVMVFGITPVSAISKIVKETDGIKCVGKVTLQLLKMLFGISYSFFGALYLYGLGSHLINKEKE